ncbi:MFS transporter [Pseudonocardia sp. MH-G8]|uniref:MFS transporter n=1 Tax=Pseudonocardia sp. MH-G8 TaxID=1854588 RepID=UPI001E4867E1|nr:MFS transporter [Pseudonocardia sp. MH-G8]
MGTLVSTYYGVASGLAPLFLVAYGLGNFLGPVTLGRLFDTLGRKPMIAGSYLGAAVLTVPLAWVFVSQLGGPWFFLAMLVLTFFVASAGASAAYLTVSEIFPMETRALAIAFFYAVGTAIGGITGPLLFGGFIESGNRELVAIGFLVSGAVVAVGGVAEILFGVRAERASLEDIAQPLTAADAEDGGQGDGDEETQAQRLRRQAEQVRADAAQHRATAADLRARDGGGRSRDDRMRAEETLAEIANLRAAELEQIAEARDVLAAARADDAALAARAGEQRARSLAERQEALGAADEPTAAQHADRAQAAQEHALAIDEQRRSAEEQRAAEHGEPDDTDERPAGPEVHRARARLYEARAAVHEARAAAAAARAARHEQGASDAERQVTRAEQQADAAEHRVTAAEHRKAADDIGARTGDAEVGQRLRREHEMQQRIRERIERRQTCGRSGLGRLRPGSSAALASARLWGSSGYDGAAERALDREIDVIARALEEHGTIPRTELARMVGARYWGPGRFSAALQAAVEEGRAQRVGRQAIAPSDSG